MFKLIKINNSRCNCPEFMKLDCMDAEVPLFNGTIVATNDNVITAPEDTPEFVLVNDYDPDKDREAVVYPISPDMIFRTFILDEPYNVYLGVSVSIASSDPSGAADCVTIDPDGNGRVVSVIGQINNRYYVDVCFDGR